MLAGFAGYAEDLAYLQSQLNTMKAALQQIARYGEQPGQWTLEAVKTRYRVLLSQLDELRREISGREMPSGFMQSLATFSDDVTNVGQTLARQTGEIIGGVAGTAKMLPLLLVGVLVVLGIGLGKGTLAYRRG